jgi:adenylylsulfate kinase-like enzyme
MIFWFIGQPGCGKTTLARALKNALNAQGVAAIHLDGDDLRVIFGGTYKSEHFTKEYRDSNTRKLQNFVEYMEKQGVNIIVSTVNGDRAIREELKSRNPRVREIYVVNTGNHVREDRKYTDFEEPVTNFVMVDTKGLTPEDALRIVWQNAVT